MNHYAHFTTEEREKSRVMRAQGFSDRAIAQSLKRSNSSVSREFARNSREDGTYSANYADKQYAERRKKVLHPHQRTNENASTDTNE